MYIIKTGGLGCHITIGKIEEDNLNTILRKIQAGMFDIVDAAELGTLFSTKGILVEDISSFHEGHTKDINISMPFYKENEYTITEDGIYIVAVETGELEVNYTIDTKDYNGNQFIAKVIEVDMYDMHEDIYGLIVEEVTVDDEILESDGDFIDSTADFFIAEKENNKWIIYYSTCGEYSMPDLEEEQDVEEDSDTLDIDDPDIPELEHEDED